MGGRLRGREAEKRERRERGREVDRGREGEKMERGREGERGSSVLSPPTLAHYKRLDFKLNDCILNI